MFILRKLFNFQHTQVLKCTCMLVLILSYQTYSILRLNAQHVHGGIAVARAFVWVCVYVRFFHASFTRPRNTCE